MKQNNTLQLLFYRMKVFSPWLITKFLSENIPLLPKFIVLFFDARVHRIALLFLSFAILTIE